MTCDDGVVQRGTTPRSHQSQIKVNSRSNWHKNVFFLLPILNSCVVQESIKNDFCSHILSRVPFKHASQWVLGHFQLGGGNYPLVFFLSHPFPNAGMNENNTKM